MPQLDIEADKVKKLISLLDGEGVAYDIGAYRSASHYTPYLAITTARECTTLLILGMHTEQNAYELLT